MHVSHRRLDRVRLLVAIRQKCRDWQSRIARDPLRAIAVY
jgi:hypothetical protein